MKDVKQCTDCELNLPLDSFSKNRSRGDGLAHQCKSCAKIRNAKWRAENVQKHRDNAKAWAVNNPERLEERMSKYRSDPKHRELARVRAAAWYYANKPYIHQRDRVDNWAAHIVERAKSSAKHRKHTHEIDSAFVLRLFESQGGRCHWTGVPMIPSVNRRDPQRPTIDRLDCSIGYGPNNCVLACLFANVGRGDTDPVRFGKFISELRKSFRRRS